MPDAAKTFGKITPTKTRYGRPHERRKRICLALAEYLCAECERQGRKKLATIADHIIPHEGDKEKMADIANYQALCEQCHADKTRQEQQDRLR